MEEKGDVTREKGREKDNSEENWRPLQKTGENRRKKGENRRKQKKMKKQQKVLAKNILKYLSWSFSIYPPILYHILNKIVGNIILL